jgi:hypothetical protein
MSALIELTVADVSLTGVFPRGKILVAPAHIAMAQAGRIGGSTNIMLLTGQTLCVAEDYNAVKALLAERGAAS